MVPVAWCRPTCPAQVGGKCECGGAQWQHDRRWHDGLEAGFMPPIPILGLVPPLP